MSKFQCRGLCLKTYDLIENYYCHFKHGMKKCSICEISVYPQSDARCVCCGRVFRTKSANVHVDYITREQRRQGERY